MKVLKNSNIDNFILSFKEIWSFNKSLIFILIFELLVTAVTPFPNIIFLGKIVDEIAVKNDFTNALTYILILFISDCILHTLSIILQNKQTFLFACLINKLDDDVNAKCLNMDYEQFNDSNMQARIQLVNQAVRGNNFFTSLTLLFSIVSRFITLVGVIIVMTSLNVWLLLVALSVIAFQAFLHSIRLKYDRKFSEDSADVHRKIGYISHLSKDVRSKKDIVSYDMSDYILKKSHYFKNNFLNLDKERNKINGIVEILTYLFTIMFQIVVYIILGLNAFNGNISIGEFTVGTTSMINFMSASSYVTKNIISFNDNLFYIRQYKSFKKLKSKYDDLDSISIENMDLKKFEIKFENVSFRYPNSINYVLRDINLVIKSGERLGVVGLNGAGKTSLILLLMRMYEPTEGTIYLNGIDIKKINYDEYQKLFSTVNQDYSIFAFSLLENIAISDEVSSEKEKYIINLLEDNGFGERIRKLYRGLKTPVTKLLSASGIDLSGGEAQKVAIVRAIYKDSPLLILDEPTAALDPISENEIYNKFIKMSNGKTAIIISHRIYSTKYCDNIAVLDNGRIMEYGSFDNLMEKRGLYYNFFKMQADNYYA